MIDPYAPCPCGSGKKYKFCCRGKKPVVQPSPPAVGQNNHHKAGADFNRAWQSYQDGRYADAELLCRYLMQMAPDFADGYYLMGLIAFRMGQSESALGWHEEAIARDPKVPEYYVDKGNALHVLGRMDEALLSYRKALKLKPRYSQAHGNMALVLKSLGRMDEAIAAYRKAIQLDPQNATAYANLGMVYADYSNDLESAIDSLKRAIALKPDYWTAMNTLGNLLSIRCGYVNEAIRTYELALAGKEDLAVRSNLLLALLYSSEVTPEAAYQKHLDYGEIYGARYRAVRRPHDNACQPGRKLRIGFVSPDLRLHSVSYFMETFLRHFDRSRFGVYVYASFVGDDDVSLRLRGYCDEWREIGQTEDDSAERTIRQDRIDILVDLAGHTGGTRLLLFARKPAPVQVTWLGYPATTGLDAMDYRLTDIYCDPVGMTEHVNSEVLVRLPETFCCFTPCISNPEWISDPLLAVRETPAKRNGYLSLGCFNNVAKLSDRTLALWGRLLRELPDCRLKVYLPGLTRNRMAANRVRNLLDEGGKVSDRLQFVDWMPPHEYLKAHHDVDIILDPFPYNGGTTSFHAVWMGVPVLTLAGNCFSARMGVSLMSNLGLTDFVAESPEQYVAIARRFASEVDELNAIRLGMRARMESSPLMDGPRFCRNLENAFSWMFDTWCKQQDAIPR